MNSLATHLQDCIRLEGPMPISRYMAEALGHPEWGYYISRDPLGRAGDFITAPEVSQMFGELIGLWCADRWQAMGAPDPFILAELGPGRGTLMADALRAGASVPGFVQAAQVHLVETSPVLRASQRAALPQDVTSCEITWHDNIADLPALPGLTIANEFFDALPIRQFQRAEDGWHERMVGLQDDALCLVLDPAVVPAVPTELMAQDAELGDIVEVSSARTGAMTELAQHIVQNSGGALVIDYGHGRSAVGDTLQAMRGHKFVAVLDDPGQADLTSHVDFQALAEAAGSAGARAYGPVGQGAFLTQLSINQRAQMLQQTATVEQAAAIASALLRLTDQDQMGQLFKVMAVTTETTNEGQTPPGFLESE